jgi:hypothetical protein
LQNEILFKGLRALELDERVPLEYALEASNCYVDHGGIEGRNGYRSVCASALTTGAMQSLSRFRTSATFARTLAVVAGTVFAVSDPSSETAADGAIQNVATPFGSTAAISAAQLGKFTYLASDDPNVAWRRARQNGSVVALDTLSTLAKGVQPTGTVTSPSVVIYSTSGSWTLSASVTKQAVGSPADWWVFQRTAVHPIAGDTATYTLPADVDMRSFSWLQVFVSPPTTDKGAGHIKVAVATNAGSFEDIGEVYDTPGGGSPDVCWLRLDSLTTATRQAVRKIRFQVSSGEGFFYVYGHLAIPTLPPSGQQQYFVTFYNSTTLQESVPTDIQTVQVGGSTVVIPQWHNLYANADSFIDGGPLSADPAKIPQPRNFNYGSGAAYPSTNDYAGVVTVSGTIPAGSQNPAADTVRLWRLTTNGYRLVKTGSIIAAQTTYSLVDDAGDAGAANQSYRGGGPPPACTALAARAARLIAGGAPATPNRLFISSYVPINTDAEGTTADPFPQFPQTNIDSSDGWSFDIATTAAEQILTLENGDALYIGTNEAVYAMQDITPNSPPYQVFARGPISRQAMIWAEERLFWAAHDGIYTCRSRTNAEELSDSIRRIYTDWFLPDSTVTLAYQDRKLYAMRGTLVLRYDFVSQTWTRHTLAHTPVQSVFWRDPSGVLQRLWFLDSAGNLRRWQSTATSDAGTAIPAWTYSTGFDFKTSFEQGTGYGLAQTRVHWVYLDVSGAATVTVCKNDATPTLGTGGNARSVSFTGAGEWELTSGTDLVGYKFRMILTAASTVTVKRAMWDKDILSSRRGGDG